MRHLLDVLDDFSFLPGVHAVGGCVRDTLLGIEAADVDLATSATPEEVMRLAQEHGLRVVPTGLAHGTVTLLHERHGSVEVTSYRRDVSCDGRRATVAFSGDIREDLARRDFTINAIALGPAGQLVDPFGGMRDLRAGVLRFVGSPRERIHEDFLRVVRGFRFEARYGFTLEPETERAMLGEAPAVPEWVSVERIVQELDKAFAAPRAGAFVRRLYDSGILTHELVLPEFAGAHALMQNPLHHPEGSVLAHTLEVIERAPSSHRWHALLHDIGKMRTGQPTPDGPWLTYHGHDAVGAEMIPVIAERLRLSNQLAASLEVVTRLHMLPLQYANANAINARAVRRFQAKAGPHLRDLEVLCRADVGERERAGMSELFTPLPEAQVKPALMGRHLLERGYRHADTPRHAGEVHFKRALEAAHQHQLDTGETNVDVLASLALASQGVA